MVCRMRNSLWQEQWGKGMDGQRLEPRGQRLQQGAAPACGTSRHLTLEGREVGMITSMGLKVRPTWIPVSALLLTSSGILGQVI